MERNYKALLVAFFIIFVVMVVFNFQEISGNLVDNEPQIRVHITPTFFDFTSGSLLIPMTIAVDAGDVGVDKTYRFYRADSESRVEGVSGTLCKESICKGVIITKHMLSSSLYSGNYFIKVKRSNKDIEVDSNIITVLNEK